jgi:type II secretion system protein G
MLSNPINKWHKNRTPLPRVGFTLIELLVVVAILAILAGIAVPNLLNAQIRSKVAVTRSNLRTLATAIECYAVDNAVYPPATGVGIYFFDESIFANPVSTRLIPLTTPTAYISVVPRDLFRPR